LNQRRQQKVLIRIKIQQASLKKRFLEKKGETILALLTCIVTLYVGTETRARDPKSQRQQIQREHLRKEIFN